MCVYGGVYDEGACPYCMKRSATYMYAICMLPKPEKRKKGRVGGGSKELSEWREAVFGGRESRRARN